MEMGAAEKHIQPRQRRAKSIGEGNGRLTQRILTVLLVLITAEALLYPSQNAVVEGLFSYSAGPFNIRLLDLAVLGAATAMALARKRGPRLLGAFYVILTLSAAYVTIMALLGISLGSGLGLIFTEARFLAYLVLLAPLAWHSSGPELLASGAEALKWASIPLLAAGAMSLARIPPVAVPGVPGSTFGAPGGDIGSIVGVLALCSVGIRALNGRASWAALWVLYPLASNQRASIVWTTIVGILAIAYVWRGSGIFGAGSFKLPVRAVVAVCAITAALAMAVIMSTGLTVVDRFVEAVAGTFTSEGKLASADTRPMELAYAWELFKEQPLSGHGLGQGVQFFDVYAGKMVASDSAHNFIADVAIRGGILGALLALGLFVSAFIGPRPWPVSKVVWSSILITLLGKALLEPAFDKYRLAFLIALALSAIVLSGRPAHYATTDTEDAIQRR